MWFGLGVSTAELLLEKFYIILNANILVVVVAVG